MSDNKNDMADKFGSDADCLLPKIRTWWRSAVISWILLLAGTTAVMPDIATFSMSVSLA